MGRRRARAWHGRSKRGDAVLHLATAHGESTRTPDAGLLLGTALQVARMFAQTGIETEVSRIRGDPYEIEVELRGALGELAVLAA
jgi:hypothetical protein